MEILGLYFLAAMAMHYAAVVLLVVTFILSLINFRKSQPRDVDVWLIISLVLFFPYFGFIFYKIPIVLIGAAFFFLVGLVVRKNPAAYLSAFLGMVLIYFRTMFGLAYSPLSLENVGVFNKMHLVGDNPVFFTSIYVAVAVLLLASIILYIRKSTKALAPIVLFALAVIALFITAYIDNASYKNKVMTASFGVSSVTTNTKFLFNRDGNLWVTDTSGTIFPSQLTNYDKKTYPSIIGKVSPDGRFAVTLAGKETNNYTLIETYDLSTKAKSTISLPENQDVSSVDISASNLIFYDVTRLNPAESVNSINRYQSSMVISDMQGKELKRWGGNGVAFWVGNDLVTAKDAKMYGETDLYLSKDGTGESTLVGTIKHDSSWDNDYASRAPDQLLYSNFKSQLPEEGMFLYNLSTKQSTLLTTEAKFTYEVSADAKYYVTTNINDTATGSNPNNWFAYIKSVDGKTKIDTSEVFSDIINTRWQGNKLIGMNAKGIVAIDVNGKAVQLTENATDKLY